MAAAKAAVTSRVHSLEAELQAAHDAGKALRSQLDERDELITKLNQRIRAMPSGGEIGTEARRGNKDGGNSPPSIGLLSSPSALSSGRNWPGASRDTAASTSTLQGGIPSATLAFAAGASPSRPSNSTLPGVSPHQSSTQSMDSEASQQTSSGQAMRKSVQSLLARVHDVRQFVEGTASSPAAAAAGTASADGDPLDAAGWGGGPAAELAERLASLSNALTDWKENS